MNLIKRLLIPAGAVLLVIPAVFAQGGGSPVDVVVTKKKLGVNENFVLEYTISQEHEERILPELKDFTILGGPSVSNSIQASFVNGRGAMARQVKINYLLQPKAEGKFTIQPLVIVSDGKKYQSEKVVIEVGKAVELPKDLNDPKSMAQENVFLTARISNRNPVVGEAVVVSYKLLYKMNVSQPTVINFPSFDGFWTERYDETQIDDSGHEEYYKNELFYSSTFYKVMLIPQKAGVFNIDPMVVRMIVELHTGRYNWFGEPEIRQAYHVIQSEAVTINVSPLPEAGRPSDFNGAVGNFQLDAKLSSASANSGESISYSIVLSGEGNLKQTELPKLDIPDEIESYQPKSSQDIRLTDAGYKGTITEDYILIPRYKGSYKIPELSFSYFDPKSKSYKTVLSPERIIDALTGKESAQNPAGQTAPKTLNRPDKMSVNYLSNDISYIEQKSKFTNVNKEAFARSRVYSLLFYFTFALIPLAFLAKLLGGFGAKDNAETREKLAVKIAKHTLSSAKRALKKHDYAKFYSSLEEALYKFILYRLKIERSMASLSNIENMFLKRGADEVYVKRLVELIESCHMARYAPQNSSQAGKDYEKAFMIIEKLG